MSLYFCSLSPFRTISGGCRLNRNVLFQPVRQSRVFTLNLLRRQKKETPQKTEIQKQDLQFYFTLILLKETSAAPASFCRFRNKYIYIFIYKKQSFTKIPRSKLVFTGRLSLLETSHTTKASDYCILHLDLPFVLLCISPSQWFSNCGVQGPHWWGVDDRGGKTRRENKMIFHQKTQLI